VRSNCGHSWHAAEGELARRELARRGLVDFGHYVYRGFVAKPFHARIALALEAVERGEIARLIISVPPRHGKSTLTSEIFPAWFLGRNPDKRIIACSYAASLAHRFSRKARNLIAGHNFSAVFGQRGSPSRLHVRTDRTHDQRPYAVTLADDSRNVGEWDLAAPYRGGYTSAGVGGSITGKGAHVLLIDDPVKGAKEAASTTIQESIWEWYLSDAYTRLEENGAIVIIMTRWSEDDLAGRVLRLAAADPEADQWVELRLPALAEEDDPLGRPEGAALWDEKFPVARLAQIAKAITARPFAALFQQRPVPAGGDLFETGRLRIVDAAPADAERVRYWDKAGTQGAGAYTAGVRMARGYDGVFYVEHVERGQWASHSRNQVMENTTNRDGSAVTVWVEQEPGSGGKESAEITVKMLAGSLVRVERVTGDKITRALPYSAQVNAGNVCLVKGLWNQAYIEELTMAPNGKYWDQIDASSGAFNKLATGPGRPSMLFEDDF